jgi:hypothetical protein
VGKDRDSQTRYREKWKLYKGAERTRKVGVDVLNDEEVGLGLHSRFI